VEDDALSPPLWHNPEPFLILTLAENRLLFRAPLRSFYVSQTEDSKESNGYASIWRDRDRFNNQ
jgi:hypothetical protein